MEQFKIAQLQAGTQTMELNLLLKEVRTQVLRLAALSREGHIASSFSIVEMLVASLAYINGCRSYRASPDLDAGPDMTSRIVLSKGHAAFGFYALQFALGAIGRDEFDRICQDGSLYYGHIPFHPDVGFEFGTGSLGHGLPFSVGRCYGEALKGVSAPRVCIIGDGEANEGTTWESMLILRKFPGMNLKILVDGNDSSERAIPLGNLVERFSSFGIPVTAVNGHEVNDIIGALAETGQAPGIVACSTKKGYPLKGMIGNPSWHHRTPTGAELAAFDAELAGFYA